jgi:probable F420-dependent oxidoreductase
MAEAYGFHSVWIVDHVVMAESHLEHFGPVFFEPLTTLAYVAGRTKSVMLGCSIMPIAYRHPLLQAKMIATLDQLSGGRAIYGGAAGYLAGEFEALGINFHHRGRIADEYIQAIKIAWTKDRPEFHGAFVDFKDIRADPKPVQRPHPTVWLGGDSDAAFRRVVRYGDGWHAVMSSGPTLSDLGRRIDRLREVALELGRGPDTLRLSVKANCVITDADTARPAQAFVGTASKVIADIREAENMGIELVVFSPNVSGPDERMDTIDQLGREVLPALTQLPERPIHGRPAPAP